MPTIALLTCRHHEHIDHASEGKLMQELVRQGAAVSLVAWTDMIDLVAQESGEATEYVDATQGGFDAIVLRTTWDYWDRLDAFREFLEGCVDEDESAFFNTAHTALANLNKIYLQELEIGGVPIVPTEFVKRGGEVAAIEQAQSNGWCSIVVKPAVGAAASGLKKFEAPNADALAYLAQLTRGDRLALVQPFMPRVTTEGETSLVYFNNLFSHAVTKVPAMGDFRSQVDFGGVYTVVEPTDAQKGVAERALAAWKDRYNDTPLYARVDLVPGDDGQPLLGELELIEPELFLDMAEDVAATFASAILARVERCDQIATSRMGWLGGRVGSIVLAVLFVAVVLTGVGTIVRWILGLLFGGP